MYTFGLILDKTAYPFPLYVHAQYHLEGSYCILSYCVITFFEKKLPYSVLGIILIARHFYTEDIITTNWGFALIWAILLLLLRCCDACIVRAGGSEYSSVLWSERVMW